MRYQTAHGIAVHALYDTQRLLQRIWDAKTGLDFNRIFLGHIRDRLNEACLRFTTPDGVEGIFLPLFHAVTLLTEALKQKPIDRANVRAAMDRLEDLAELLQASPVVA